MIFGKLDRKLTLLNQVYTTNAYGERIAGSGTSVTIYGDFNFKSGKANYESDVFIGEQRIECLIRYRDSIGVSPDFYIRNGDTSYAITGIREVGRKDKMILTLERKDLKDIFST